MQATVTEKLIKLLFLFFWLGENMDLDHWCILQDFQKQKQF